MTPPKVLDKRGTPIEVGSRVAYNLGGQVAVGEVVDTWKPNARRFKIVPDPEFLCWSKLSRVRHPLNLIVLKDGEA